MIKIIFTLFFTLLQISWAHSSSLPDLLSSLYPGQTQEFINSRIQSAETDYDKWRSFTRLYYYLLKNNNHESFNWISEHKGFCAGDAHPENFGFMLMDKKSSLFTVNDIDDSDDCFVFYDFMRFLITAQLWVESDQLEILLENYKKGLKQLKMEPSALLASLESASIERGKKPTKKFSKFIKNSSCTGSDYFEISEQQKKDVEAAIKALGFPKADHVCLRIKQKSGSAGMLRYVFWFKNIQGVHEVWDLKEVGETGPSFLMDQTLTLDEKLKQIQLHLYQDNLRPLHFIKVGQKSFWAKINWDGDLELKEDEFTVEQRVELLENIAYILGQLHQSSLASNQKYIKDLESVTVFQIQQIKNVISKKYLSLFKDI